MEITEKELIQFLTEMQGQERPDLLSKELSESLMDHPCFKDINLILLETCCIPHGLIRIWYSGFYTCLYYLNRKKELEELEKLK